MPNLSSPDIPPVQEGEILDGKYRVDKVLGVGGMGIVVAATHVQLNTRVAIKFLLPAAMGNPQIIERFAREARAAVQIQSEHVARVTDVGTLPTGSPYMVMEFLEGSDLAAAIERGGAMPVAQAVGFVLQACEAIAEAHALGIVHRDLKPSNLFVARRADGSKICKVLDFGVARFESPSASGDDEDMTADAEVVGSMAYMAPEQMLDSKHVDARADVWSLGVLLYYLVTGERPFGGKTQEDIALGVITGAPRPLPAVRPDLPDAFVDVVHRCLEKDCERRYAGAVELARALAPFTGHRARSAPEAEMIRQTLPLSDDLQL